MESAPRWIRFGEIENRYPLRPLGVEQLGEGVRSQIPIKARRKFHHATRNTQYEIRIAYFVELFLTVFIKPRHHAVQTIHAVMRLATAAHLVPFAWVTIEHHRFA